MADIALSISCKIDGVDKVILLENIEDNSITASSTISRHPIPTGEYVADTMYKEPISMSVSGSFSMNGRSGITILKSIGGKFEVETDKMSLEEIEKFFETLKNSGTLCNIVKVKIVDNSPRFTIRNDMILQSITWREKINAVVFDFSFQQIMQVDIQEYNVDESDDNLPDLVDPKTLNFTESLLDTDKLISLTNQICIDEGILEQALANYISSLGNDAKFAAIVGVSAAVLIALIGASFGLALIVGAVACIGAFLYKAISKYTKSYGVKIRTYRKYFSNKKSMLEAKAYLEMLNDIKQHCDQLNQKMIVYQVSSDKAHQAILSIDDDYYCFTFTRNNNNNSFGLTILNMDGQIAQNTKTISNIKKGALFSIDDCNQSTAILTTNSGYQVYLMNPYESRTDKLTECYIFISSIDMAKYDEMLADVIKQYLLH